MVDKIRKLGIGCYKVEDFEKLKEFGFTQDSSCYPNKLRKILSSDENLEVPNSKPCINMWSGKDVYETGIIRYSKKGHDKIAREDVKDKIADLLEAGIAIEHQY